MPYVLRTQHLLIFLMHYCQVSTGNEYMADSYALRLRSVEVMKFQNSFLYHSCEKNVSVRILGYFTVDY